MAQASMPRRLHLKRNGLGRILAICCALLLIPGAQAKDLALLIGVGSYRNPDYNLSGIDKDLDLMRVVAGRLGFVEGDIRTLADAEVTVANIEQAFTSWLVPQAGEHDRVLIYFSGHGTQVPDDNGDEADGADEVLTTYELKEITSGPRPTLEGVIKDDDLNRLLKSLRSREVLLLVDACHSGTVAKGAAPRLSRSVGLKDKSLGVAEGQPKFFYYPGMPESRETKALALRDAVADGEGFALLAAAADYEQALATSRGSVFTLGVADAVEAAIRDGAERLTLEILKDKTDAYIDRYVQTSAARHQRHRPQLMGAPELIALNLLSRDGPSGDTNASLYRRLLEDAEPLAVSLIGSERLEEGDLLRLRVEIPAAKGHLNILEIDAQDQVRVLFPNRFHPDNAVRRGTLELPDPSCLFGEGCFDWPIQAPFGPSQVIALFTRRPINLFEASDGHRDASGRVLDTFPLISIASTRSATAQAAVYGGATRYRACPFDGPCD